MVIVPKSLEENEKANNLYYIASNYRIYSKITSLTEQEKDNAMKAISKSFEGNDKLEPLRFLFIYLNDIDKQHFIMKQPSTQKIKEFSTMLIPIVTVLISILQLLLSKSR
jgi:hypothetical protein